MLFQEIVHVGRALRKSPGFTLIAILTLALGIGASTAIFSVTNAVLLRPLPYKDPERLVLACSDLRKRNVKDFPMSNADFVDLRKGANHAFEDFAAVRTGGAVLLREDGTPEHVRTGFVSPNFFALLGARMASGRDFTEADGLPQPAPPPSGLAPGQAPLRLPNIVILSYEYWQRRYSGDPNVLGKSLVTGPGFGAGTQIVGVLAPGFELLFPPESNMERTPDFFMAARINYDPATRNNVQWRVIARMKPVATLDQAQQDAEAVAIQIRASNAISNTAGQYIRIEPMKKHLVTGVESTIVALMGAVVFLLLIACANVANLVLVRMSLRARDLAVRAAIGGSWWNLVRQLLTESLMPGGAGALLGVGLAWAGIRELLAITPANLPRLEAVRIDPVVLGFTALACLASVAIFGLAPALRAARPDLMHLLRGSGRTTGLGSSGMVRNGVVVAEVALSFVLLSGCGLMIRSFIALQHVNPGFDPHNLLTFQLLGGPPGNTQPAQRAAFIRQVHDRLAAIPGVLSVTASFPFPLTGNFSPIRWGTNDALSDPSKFQAADLQFVLPGYFQTMGTPIMDGREFTEANSAPDRKLVIIDQALAAKAFPGESAVGKRILVRINSPQAEWVDVIGVAAHQRNTDLALPGREQVYVTDGFAGFGAVNRWALRTADDPAKFAAAVREEIRKQHANMLVTELRSMGEWVDRAQAGTRFSLLLIGIFAVIAAVLAAVGLYGVLSTVVRQRTAEIGVRVALGAAPSSIFRLVVGQGLRLSAAGIGVGLVAAFALTRIMATMLIGVKPTDPPTFAAMALVFVAIAAAASWLPARRAAGLDPTQALREE